MLLFSGSAAPELLLPPEAAFRKAIEGSQRLERVLQIREEILAEKQHLSVLLEESYGELARISPLYEADTNQFRDIFYEFDSERTKSHSVWLDKRFELKELMTRKEWKKVYGRR